MNIDWNPSETLLARMKKIEDLAKQGKTNVQIAKEFGLDRAYIVALKRKFKQMKGEGAKTS